MDGILQTSVRGDTIDELRNMGSPHHARRTPIFHLILHRDFLDFDIGIWVCTRLEIRFSILLRFYCCLTYHTNREPTHICEYLDCLLRPSVSSACFGLRWTPATSLVGSPLCFSRLKVVTSVSHRKGEVHRLLTH